MTEYQLAAMSRVGEHGEPIFRAPSVGCSGETDLRKALREAATSLETIGRLAGRGEFMLEDSEVRAYANSRASVARDALVATGETS
uniref:Uncharacterized protein n=1 Tax=Variovorax paradoxus (strain S110) TaxID=543728 RepID=C5CJK8_VARPS